MEDVQIRKKQRIETETDCFKESIMALGLKTANVFIEGFESDVRPKFNTIVDLADIQDPSILLKEEDEFMQILIEGNQAIISRTERVMNKALQKIQDEYDVYNIKIDALYEDLNMTKKRILRNKLNQLEDEIGNNTKNINNLIQQNLIIEDHHKRLLNVFTMDE